MKLIISYLDIVLLDDLRRLGFIIDFLSKATIIGFMAGAAIKSLSARNRYGS